MADLRNHDPWCVKCIYYAKSTRSCDYILIEDHPRPCPGGQGCTARRTRRATMPGIRKPQWDTELGRLLWLDGKTDAQIAEELGIGVGAVTSYRTRHWMKGTARPEPKEQTAPLRRQPRHRPHLFRNLRSRNRRSVCLLRTVCIAFWKRQPRPRTASRQSVQQMPSSASGTGIPQTTCAGQGPLSTI